MTEKFIGIFLQLSIFLFYSWLVNSYCELMNLHEHYLISWTVLADKQLFVM